ncbi:YhcH/YjgK/YiaL family protein [Chitinibacter bivalviorum]|uniref:YhcH/YjgK/YiaL family protein n=1 Tax=Chitinibacter bivalviorum TaxID=2739434 RepID=A0A7H9BMM9_9NEIS|nr:YhcH/YjgK/YiaL family protein [Chitinibacter bivalviorum]QLG89646.1 YhcH/YjgK/YiaL family protein [Chitinibacter bivalviorum]
MYFSHLAHPQPPLPAAIERALNYLRSTDFSQLATGRHPIEGDQMIAIVQTPQTQPWETGMPEFHRRYIDIQYLLEGEEIIGFGVAQPELPLATDQLAERDIAFVHPIADESRLHLKPGMFAIFFPGELHKPCRCVQQSQLIKKIVIKIDAALLNT